MYVWSYIAFYNFLMKLNSFNSLNYYLFSSKNFVFMIPLLWGMTL